MIAEWPKVEGNYENDSDFAIILEFIKHLRLIIKKGDVLYINLEHTSEIKALIKNEVIQVKEINESYKEFNGIKYYIETKS